MGMSKAGARKNGGERGIRTLGGSFPPHSLSRRAPSADSAISPQYNLAEGVGFEPTELSLNGFQDRRLKPLGHPSGLSSVVHYINNAFRVNPFHRQLKKEEYLQASITNHHLPIL